MLTFLTLHRDDRPGLATLLDYARDGDTVTRVGTLGGYGYRTGRIALTLLIVLLAAAGLGISAGHISTRPGRERSRNPPSMHSD